MTKRPYAALAGLLATIAALSVGELAAGLVSSWYSPVQAVGDTVIYFTPRPMKEFAIQAFGTNDKLALIIGTLLITLAFGAGVGDIGRKRIKLAWAGVLLFGVLGVAATVFQDSLGAAVPSILAVVVGIPLITVLLRLAPTRSTDAAAADGSSAHRPGRSRPGHGRTRSLGLDHHRHRGHGPGHRHERRPADVPGHLRRRDRCIGGVGGDRPGPPGPAERGGHRCPQRDRQPDRSDRAGRIGDRGGSASPRPGRPAPPPAAVGPGLRHRRPGAVPDHRRGLLPDRHRRSRSPRSTPTTGRCASTAWSTRSSSSPTRSCCVAPT